MPRNEDKESLVIFVEEAKEHLEGIEDDLLAIESRGAEIDVERVNNVFRAVHTIKGGAGFMGLNNVKDLAHAMEDLLNKIRRLELLPSAAVITPLLDAADQLNSMIHSIETSNEFDITKSMLALQQVLASEAGKKKPKQPEREVVHAPSVAVDHSAPEHEPDGADYHVDEGKTLFGLAYDLIADIEQKGKTLLGEIAELRTVGSIHTIKVDLDSIGLLEELDFSRLAVPVEILFSTVLEKELLVIYTQLDIEHVWEVGPENPSAPDSGGPEESGEENDRAACREMSGSQADRTPETVSGTPPQLKGSIPAEVPWSEFSTVRKNETSAFRSTDTAPTVSDQPGSGSGNSLRVNVKVLDNLMALTGELVLTRNQLLMTSAVENHQDLERVAQRLNLVTSELQEAVMTTRMQPIDKLFNIFKRLVRKLARDLGKEIKLVIEGEMVEVDKTIIEAVSDPLAHLIRNAVGHGIETPEARLRAGKSSTGTISLSAFHSQGQVVLVVEDDGIGVDPKKIKEKALTIGPYSRAQLDAMSESELIKLILLPGLTTAAEVTEVSGRGVGMDVVQANLNRLGGVVSIDSKLGQGTCISIKLPLTLAIIPSLIVSIGQERYAVPQINLVELVRIPASQVKHRLERIGNAKVMRLREKLLPLIHLSDVLRVEPAYFDSTSREEQAEKRKEIVDRRGIVRDELGRRCEESPAGSPGNLRQDAVDRRQSPLSAYNILVVTTGELQYGFIVDTLHDPEEIVVKPFGSHLSRCKAYAGATILGDGGIVPILDVSGMSAMMNLAAVPEKVRTEVIDGAANETRKKQKQSFLLACNTPDEPLAFSLGLVARIEKIQSSQVKLIGGRLTLAYRGGSLPLFAVDEVAAVSPRDAEEVHSYVVVFPLDGRDIGILVSRVIDVMVGEFDIDTVSHRQPGILGSAEISGRITLIIDPYEVVSTVMPEWQLEPTGGGQFNAVKANVLIVDDSLFYRSQLQCFVEEAGYSSVSASDGLEALAMLARERVDIVITDIEMPNLDGLGLVRKMREDNRWMKIPVIAVTSLASQEAKQEGFDAGVNDYLVKLDREEIVGRLREHLG